MIFDFFNKSTVAESLCQHFSIDKRLFNIVVKMFDYVHESPCDFAKKLGIDLLTNTDDCQIICRHITTTNDNLNSIMTKGMLSLDRVLTEDTPLNAFLKSYGIEIDPKNRNMRIRDKVVLINGFDEPCDPCYRNSTYTIDKRKRLHCCSFNQEMAFLNNKLYHDKSEIEAFIRGSDEELLSYQSVLNAPEILLTVGRIISSVYTNSEDFLQISWSKQKGMKRYILEFPVPVNALDTNTDQKSRSGYDEYEEWIEYSNFNSKDYYENNIPLKFYRNIKLLRVGLDVMLDYAIDKYCQILPEYTIMPSDIKVHREYVL